jgi:hypothetical protein
LSNRDFLTSGAVPALIPFITPFIVSSDLYTLCTNVQLANGASHGPNSLTKHPSQRLLLHNYPIVDFQSRRRAEFRDSGLSASRNCHVWCLEELAITVQLQACWRTAPQLLPSLILVRHNTRGLYSLPPLGPPLLQNSILGNGTIHADITVYPPAPPLLQNSILGTIRFHLHWNFHVPRW